MYKVSFGRSIPSTNVVLIARRKEIVIDVKSYLHAVCTDGETVKFKNSTTKTKNYTELTCGR